MEETITLDLEYVNSLRTVRGGFTKALTDELGITYPYTKGWVRELAKEKRVITVDYYFYLQGLSDKLTESTKKQHRKRGIT